jgi:hypothetical protein
MQTEQEDANNWFFYAQTLHLGIKLNVRTEKELASSAFHSFPTKRNHRGNALHVCDIEYVEQMLASD